MIDLHAHLLPGIDDGPGTMEEATEMCRVAAEDGIVAAVATPHQHHDLWPNMDREALSALFEELWTTVGGAPTLALGAEIRVDSELLSEMDRLPEGDLLPLAGSRYLLLEFAPFQLGVNPRTLVHELVVAGWRPVLAHPERIPWLAEEPGLLADLVEGGALLQLTAMSVTGELGRSSKVCSSQLLEEGLAHFVASDAHDARVRPPRLSKAYGVIAERWGEERAKRLFVDNPKAVLENRPIERHNARDG
jgi:protein-tyrosine phosphatase